MTITSNVNGELIRKSSYDEMIKTLDGKAKFYKSGGDDELFHKYRQHSEHFRRVKYDPRIL